MTVTAPSPEANHGVTLNPRYGTWIRGQVLALQVPGGFYAVKVRQVGDTWVAYAAPRRNTTAEPFLIGYGTDRDQVIVAAIKWRDCATTLVMRMDRVVYAGGGNATLETLPGFDPASLLTAEVAA